MFDLGLVELLIILVVALFVMGPDDFPKVVRGLAQMVRKATELFDEAKRHIEDEGSTKGKKKK